MSRYIVINTSPRPHGNCQFLATRLIEKIEAAGHEVKLVDFRKESINFCLACDACMKHDEAWCAQKDDMSNLLPELDSCDGVIFLSPVYWYSITAQAKVVIDRLYAFFNPGMQGMTVASKSGKRVGIILTSGSMGEGSLDSVVDATVAGAFGIAGFTERKTLLFSGLNTPGCIGQDKVKLAQVDTMGEWLIGQ
jgi:multimeric flavodoxin WrbA